MRRIALRALAIGLLVLAGCGDDGGSSSDATVTADSDVEEDFADAAPVADAGPVGDVVITPGISGRVTFDRVPVDLDLPDEDSRLDYDATFTAPVADAVVTLIIEGPGNIAMETTTDEDGRYRFEGPDLPPHAVRVRVYSSMLSPDYAVHDNTSGDAVYALDSEPVLAADGPVVDLHASSGWDGNRYTQGERAAAPFAILDTLRRLARRFEEVSDVELLPVRAGWSPLNRKTDGDNDTGAIGTTFWSNGSSTIYVLGDEDADTDEYDEHILTHEWGHYLMDRVSRDDSLGGSHSGGAALDARVAWSEGWSSALGAFLNAPVGGYGDTKGDGQQSGWSEDVEDNFEDCGDGDDGVFFECVSQSIAFDLLDPIASGGADHGDGVELGWDGAVDLITGPLVDDTASLITLATVLATAKAARPPQAAAIDVLSKLHGVDPVQDEFGTGQTSSDGGFSANLPLYHLVEIDGPGVAVKMQGHDHPGSRDNRAESNRFITFRGKGKPVLVRADADVDVDLFVFDAGHEIASEEGSDGHEVAEIAAKDGVLYVAAVQSWHDEPEAFTCQVTVTSATTGRSNARPPNAREHRHAKPGPPVTVRFERDGDAWVAVVASDRDLNHVVLEGYVLGVRGSHQTLHAGPILASDPLSLPLPSAPAGGRLAVWARARNHVAVFTSEASPLGRPGPRLGVLSTDPRYGEVVVLPSRTDARR